jgi:hypothetical protein
MDLNLKMEVPLKTVKLELKEETKIRMSTSARRSRLVFASLENSKDFLPS